MSTSVLPTDGRPRFEDVLTDVPRRTHLTTLQINIGRLCNLSCRHCHVESSPARTAPEDNMSRETAASVVGWALRQPSITTVDFTGGSPEMNPNFRWMVGAFAKAGLHIMSRCNPTVIEYKGEHKGEHRGFKTREDYSWVPNFFAENRVEVIASLPCYLEENVDRQRGRGSFDASIRGLLALNAVGYGTDPALRLNLVYNPVGPSLPPGQDELEADYKRELGGRFGLVFNELWTITNMPIQRWRRDLERKSQLESYLTVLADAFNPETLPALMCRQLISIGPDGRVYDCDFNQALELPTPGLGGRMAWELDGRELIDRPIVTGDHCFGCTAGAGSSCGGALV